MVDQALRTSLIFLLGLVPLAAGAQPTPLGKDFQVNVYTTSSQTYSAMGQDASGDFVVVWRSNGSAGTDSSEESILARRFSSDGAAIGDEFQVNSGTEDEQRAPDISVNSSGAFVIVWESRGLPDDEILGIRGQRYGSDGSAVGTEFAVNSYTTGLQTYPAVAINDHGEFVVVWDSQGSDGTSDTSFDLVLAQRFASDGSPVATEFQVNTYTTGNQTFPDVAYRSDGSFIATWSSDGSSGDDSDSLSIQAQLFHSDGSALGAEVQVNSYVTSSQRDPRLAVHDGGSFTVAWVNFGASPGDDTDSRSVQARRFDSSGSAIGDDFQVNTYTTASQTRADVAALDSGEFMVTWESYGDFVDGGQSIQAAYFDSDGSRVGEQFLVNTITTGSQSTPVIASDAERRFVIGWTSGSSTGTDQGGSSIQARRFEFIDVEGQVFLDADFDGTRGAGEPAVENVLVHLYDAADGSLLESTVTDGAGAYLFADRVGEYFVEFEAQPAYSFTFRDRGLDDSVDSDVDPITGRTVDFLSAETAVWDAGLTNGIGDRIWLDVDGDGLQDQGEAGVDGVTVQLFTQGGSQVASTVSDADGSYAFADLSPETYYLQFTAPEGFSFSPRAQGSDAGLDSDADESTGVTALIFFAGGDLRLDLDCGLIEEQSLTQDGPEPSFVTEDFQINQTTTSGQIQPAVAELTDGSFAVVWMSPNSGGDDVSGDSIQLRRIGPDGSPVGGEAQVNTVTTGDQIDPDVAALADGGFVVVWQSDFSDGDDGDDASVQMRRFDSAGSAVGDDMQVNQATTSGQGAPVVAARSDGRFLVVWQNEFDDSIRAQVFDSGGVSVGDELNVNTLNRDSQFAISATALGDGDFAVVWLSVSLTNDEDYAVRGRLVGADGVASGAADFQISNRSNGYYQDPTVAGDDGAFLVAWSSGEDGNTSIPGRLVDAAGTPLASQLTLTTRGASQELEDQAHLAGLGDGGYLLTWRTDRFGGDGDSFGLFGQRLDVEGSSIGGEFQVNSFTAGSQSEPHVAVGQDGRLFGAWRSDESPGDDDSGNSIVGRMLQLPGELGDLVFLDEDLDGLQDDAEPGLEGVTVSLLGESGELLGQTSTDQSGDYRFYLTESANVLLGFESPEGLSATATGAGDDALDSDVDPASGETALFTAPLGVIDRDVDAGFAAGLGDLIWLDQDGNGVQDSGEAGVPGVTVTLYDGTVDAAGAQVAQTTTDADGRYVFFAPAAGAYFLEVTAPAGFEFTARDQGNEDADSDVNGAGRTATFLYVEGSIDTDFDAGLVPEVTASVGDRVWLDANLNGLQDPGEAGFEGVVVELFDASGSSRGTATTAIDGSYAFAGLAAGTYYLGFSEPAGFCYTARDAGNDDGADSDVDPQTFTTALFSLAEGAVDTTRDAGLVPDASIGNRVWFDDGDGIQTGGEPGIENVTVRLYDGSDALLESTVTDSSGHYAFSPGPGEYYLEFVLPADTAFAPRDQGGTDPGADELDSDVFAATGTTSLFTLTPGQVDTSRDAGLEPTVIGNRVWLDQNADGLQQPGEPGIAGVQVRLLGSSGAVFATTLTDSNGLYQFLGVPSGNYRIEVAPPTGAVFSAPDVGVDDLIDSDVDPQTGRSKLFPYTAGTANRRWDAGLRIPPLFADGFESGNLSAWARWVAAGSQP